MSKEGEWVLVLISEKSKWMEFLLGGKISPSEA